MSQQSILATADNQAFTKAIEAFKKTSTMQGGSSYPHILIIGPSGSGKSNCLRNLPPAETGIINVEGKVLPFNETPFSDSHLNSFEHHASVMEALKIFAEAPHIKYIVIDSYTKWNEILYNFCRKTKTNWDIQNLNNDTIFELLESIKKIKNKFVIMTGIDEIIKVDTVTGAQVRNRRLAVEGKKWEGKIEKEFTIVLFTDVQPIQGQVNKFKYQFITNSDGTTSAKCPQVLGLGREIDNDIKLVTDACIKHYQLK